mgnify:CR=1 FL=1
MILQKWKNKTASSCQQSMDFFNRRMSFYIECKIKFSRHRSRKDSSHYMPSFTWYEYRIYMTDVWWSRTLNFEEPMFDVVPCWLLIAIPCRALLYSLLVECIFSKKKLGKKRGKKKLTNIGRNILIRIRWYSWGRPHECEYLNLWLWYMIAMLLHSMFSHWIKMWGTFSRQIPCESKRNLIIEVSSNYH